MPVIRLLSGVVHFCEHAAFAELPVDFYHAVVRFFA